MQLDNVCYPIEFQSAYIKEHPRYEDDLKKLLDRSGFEDRFSGLYKQRLMFLEERHKLCVQRRSWFEVLKYANGVLYAIKFKVQKNIRILFCFIEHAGMEYAVLLYPFVEKESGKSKDSYSAAIITALSRLREVIKQ